MPTSRSILVKIDFKHKKKSKHFFPYTYRPWISKFFIYISVLNMFCLYTNPGGTIWPRSDPGKSIYAHGIWEWGIVNTGY